MGQKVNPIANRLGFIKGWDSNWYDSKSYAANEAVGGAIKVDDFYISI